MSTNTTLQDPMILQAPWRRACISIGMAILVEAPNDGFLLHSIPSALPEDKTTCAYRPPPSVNGVEVKAMQVELDRLAETIEDADSKKLFELEMRRFLELFARYVAERSQGAKIEWGNIHILKDTQVKLYNTLPQSSNPRWLEKLAVLKCSGGLGKSMGLTGAKITITLKDKESFLDVTLRQLAHLNETHNVEVPLLVMTSPQTHAEVAQAVQASSTNVRVTTFNQSRYPRINEFMLPCAKDVNDDSEAFCPPGHGDVFSSLFHSGLLDRLLKEKKEYLFLSNCDNLGAVVDPAILQHMIKCKAEFLMEVTDRTRADANGGTLVEYDGSIQLLEVGQVPETQLDDFQAVCKFNSFNTNNLWINLHALKRVMDKGMPLNVVVEKSKEMDGRRPTIQLSTSAGSAIKHFKNAHAINVPRSRFLSIKTCSDLLLVRSDFYALMENGSVAINEARMFGTGLPIIKLGEHFRKIEDFEKRVEQAPSIFDLDHLTVTGDVSFGRNVVLSGTVIIAASEGQKIEIPDGCVLENVLLTDA